jgi:hypothetical protein
MATAITAPTLQVPGREPPLSVKLTLFYHIKTCDNIFLFLQQLYPWPVNDKLICKTSNAC